MLLDTHTQGFAGVAGNTQITAVHLSLTWLPHRRSIWGSNGTHSPWLPLLHLPRDLISTMCPAKLLCDQSTPKGKLIHTFMWWLCSALHKYLWPPSQIQNEWRARSSEWRARRRNSQLSAGARRGYRAPWIQTILSGPLLCHWPLK